jgi:hypothetical protein
MTYHLLRRALGAGSKPTTIVFDLKPSLQVGGLEYYVRNLAEVATPAELLDACRSERFRKSAAELIIEWLLPSYRCRREIRNDLLAALAGTTARLRNLNRLCERNWTVNDGVNITTPNPGYHGEVTEAEHNHLISRGFFPDRTKTEYVRRLLTLAGDRGIRAYLVLPPFVPDLRERREQTGAERKYEAYIRSLQDRFPDLTVLDARDGGYPATIFVDPIHLDVRGTLALSSEVAAVLHQDFERAGKAEEPRRWVRLPAYRERPIPADLEDVELSRTRLGLPPFR